MWFLGPCRPPRAAAKDIAKVKAGKGKYSLDTPSPPKYNPATDPRLEETSLKVFMTGALEQEGAAILERVAEKALAGENIDESIRSILHLEDLDNINKFMNTLTFEAGYQH